MTKRLFRNGARATRNVVCSLRRHGLGCVILPLRGSYPERTLRRDPLPFPFSRLPLTPSDPSLEDTEEVIECIGGDSRVRSVVLRFDTLRAGASSLYSLRRLFLALRGRGKRLVAWLPGAGTWDYYLASACNEIVLPASGQIAALGLRAEAVFFRDLLALAGVEADFESIAEYKVSPDAFRRSSMSEPHREMLDAIVGSTFAEIVAAIAEGRRLEPARVRELIDGMPLSAAEAVDAGLADAVLYEDELPGYLAHADAPGGEPHPLCMWEDASRWLRRPLKRRTRRSIGVVSLEGLIMPGRSRRIPSPVPLPFVEAQAGAETITQTLRNAGSNERMAAVVLLVDSPGGSSLASDLVWREVQSLRERKPVVALLGTQAASGGYYVAAAANRIVARPTTLTGSIGVWGGKIVLAGLYGKLGLSREGVQRGAMAGLHSEMAPFGGEERARIRRAMGEVYARFKACVAQGRGMAEERVEGIARGRVWTGAQACELGLVDALGDFGTALETAKELAGIDAERDIGVVQVRPPRHELPPPLQPLAQATGNDGALACLHDLLRGLARERVWALAPWSVQVRE
jgi:protease-4